MATATERALYDMACGCLMTRTRLVARKVTALYEDGLRPYGLKGSQLSLLCAVASAGPARRKDISNILMLDNSTLTRNLAVMLRNGWVEEVADAADGRGAPLRATPAGLELLKRVMPVWRSAQRRAEKLLGEQGRASIMDLSTEIAVPR